ncbi:hypothetical protein [Streptomyces turgidiscabies]|uniref:Uncharacterized protein n=1 Tax=Streptomyces turgidiscabies TaxID=85558 RepID=A0ABU0S0V7_9ACTN|nr:hypothetical protein [Streptomyces turgidiscabies]MDQ0937870.1 hypothetical protein [Streptomyces turgidiscabies]
MPAVAAPLVRAVEGVADVELGLIRRGEPSPQSPAGAVSSE